MRLWVRALGVVVMGRAARWWTRVTGRRQGPAPVAVRERSLVDAVDSPGYEVAAVVRDACAGSPAGHRRAELQVAALAAAGWVAFDRAARIGWISPFAFLGRSPGIAGRPVVGRVVLAM